MFLIASGIREWSKSYILIVVKFKKMKTGNFTLPLGGNLT